MSIFPQKIIGLEISSHTVRVMAIKKGKRPRILKFGIATLPAGAVLNGSVMDGEAVARAINEALQTAKIKVKKAVISVDCRQVAIKQVKLPKMKTEELRNALQWEVEQYLPVSASEAVLDFQVWGEFVENGATMQDILLVACPMEMVTAPVKAVHKAGLKVMVVDIEPMAIARVLFSNAQWDDRQLALAKSEILFSVDLGANSTKITLFYKGQIELNRIVPLGTDHFTSALAQKLNISFPAAEAIIIDRGIQNSAENQEGRPMGDDLVTTDLQEVAVSTADINSRPIPDRMSLLQEISPMLQEIIMEIRRTLEFFRFQHRNDVIDRIVLTGGGTLLKGLPEILSESLEIKVVNYNPLEFVKYNKKKLTNIEKYGPRLTKIIGLAMREVR